MRSTLLTGLIVFFLSPCIAKPYTTEAKQMAASNPFDSLMTSLVSTYPKLPAPSDSDYSKWYLLRKRVFLPIALTFEGRVDLNFELRQYSVCGGCWEYQVIYIYNDSIHYILPLTDFYYYWTISGGGPETIEEIRKDLHFKKEFNKLLAATHTENWQLLTDVFMTSMLDYYPVTKYDIPKLQMIAKDVLSKSRSPMGGELYSYNENCRNNIEANLKLLEARINENNSAIYSNGKLVFIFREEKGTVDVEVLNPSCLAMFLW